MSLGARWPVRAFAEPAPRPASAPPTSDSAAPPVPSSDAPKPTSAPPRVAVAPRPASTRVKRLPIEVKAGARPRLADATHLRSFRKEYGKKARAGLLLHTGGTIEWLAPDVLAAPWWTVL